MFKRAAGVGVSGPLVAERAMGKIGAQMDAIPSIIDSMAGKTSASASASMMGGLLAAQGLVPHAPAKSIKEAFNYWLDEPAPTRDEAYKRVVERFRELDANPQKVDAMLAHFTEQYMDGAPEIAAETVRQYKAALAHIVSVLPKTNGQTEAFAPKPTGKATLQDQQALADRFEVLRIGPMGGLVLAKEKRNSPAAMDTTVRVFNKTQEAGINKNLAALAATTGTVVPGTAARAGIHRLMTLDTGPGSGLSFTQPKPPSGGGGGGGGPKLKAPDLSTRVQRLSSR